MCPGGFVLSSGTDADGLVCNGMSNYHRNSPFANSAIVISIDHDARFGTDLFGGLKFRRALERSALDAVRCTGGTKEIPVQDVVSFSKGARAWRSSHRHLRAWRAARLDQVLPADLTNRLRTSVEEFDRHMKGFISREAQFHGVESRTSCPIRITRDGVSLQSVSHAGLYPAGEGAGYAGGITSAACDGIRIAEAIAASFSTIGADITAAPKANR